MKNSVKISWLDGMSFEGEINGHKIMLDADEKVGGTNKGARPKPFMLLALAGCTAMDVVSILKKMKVELKKFDTKVEGVLTEEQPKHYKEFKIIYIFEGENLDRKKIEKAINLSLDKYCGVSHVYKQTMKSSYEIQIIEK